MIWGEIGGTSFRLGALDMPITGGDSAPTFKILDVPTGEKMAQEMTEMITNSRGRETSFKDTRLRNGTNYGKTSMISPAARRFGLGVQVNLSKALKTSYTPTRTRIPSTGVCTPSSSLVLGRSSSRTQSDASPIVTNSSIADSLLQCGEAEPTQNKPRPPAAVFF